MAVPTQLNPWMAGDWRTQQLPPSTGPYQPGASGISNTNLPSGRMPVNASAQNPWAGPSGGNIQGNQPSSGRSALMHSLMSPEAIAAISMGSLGMGSQILANRANGQEKEKNRELRRQELMSGLLGDEMTDDRARQEAYLKSMQMDPVSQSRDLFSANLLRDIAGRGAAHVTPGQGVGNPFEVSDDTMGFLAPSALAENASRFYGAAGSIDPHQQRPDMAAMGFGDAGIGLQGGLNTTINDAAQRAEASRQSRRQALMSQVQATPQQGGQPGQPGQPQQHKGNGFLKMFSRIAPFAAMAIPFAGPALGMGMMAANGVAAGVGAAGALANRNPVGAAGYGANMAQDYFNRRPGGR